MVISILYTYFENLKFTSGFIFAIMVILLGMLIAARAMNDIDKDDWQILMIWAVPITIFFLFLTMIPSIDDITETHRQFTAIQTQSFEKSKEVINYPSVEHTSVNP